MPEKSEVRFLIKVGIIAAFATLAFVGTTVIRIPIPASGGYFNLGDTFVMLGALLYGPTIGLFVGLFGPSLADAVGFPQFILATAIIKSIEGYVVGLINSGKKPSSERTLMALLCGIVILVGGYYIFEVTIYPIIGKSIPFFAVTDKNAAIAELIPNSIQGLLSAVIAFGIYKVFKGRSID